MLMSKDIDKMTEVAHKYFIPLLYTILWVAGILLCGKEIASDNEVLKNLSYGNFFISVYYIYVVFILECVIAIFDKALENIRSQFNVWLLILLCVILLNVGLTLWFSFSYIFENDACAFWCIIILMISLKFISAFFSNNIHLFMVKFHLGTKTSDFGS